MAGLQVLAVFARRRWRGSAAGTPLGHRSARRAQGGPARCRRSHPQSTDASRQCRGRRASSIPRNRPAPPGASAKRRRRLAGRRSANSEAAPPDAGPGMGNRMRFWNSDAAFNGDLLFLGSYHGFTVYDIERAEKPQLRASVVCPGGQGDVSIYGNLLFVSVEETTRTGRLRDTRRPGAGQRRALPRRPDLRRQGPQQSTAGGGGADLSGIAYAHAGRPIRRTRATSTSTGPASAPSDPGKS